MARTDWMRYPAHNFEITEIMMAILRDHLKVDFSTFPTMDLLPVEKPNEGEWVTHYEGTPMEYEHFNVEYEISAYVGRLTLYCRTTGKVAERSKHLDMRFQLERVEVTYLPGGEVHWMVSIWHHGLKSTEKPQKAAFIYWMRQRELTEDTRLKNQPNYPPSEVGFNHPRFKQAA